MEELKDRSQLIFNYGSFDDSPNSKSTDEEANKSVDLEIIFLGPKSKRSSSKYDYRVRSIKRNHNNKSPSSPLTKSLDTSGFDPSTSKEDSNDNTNGKTFNQEEDQKDTSDEKGTPEDKDRESFSSKKKAEQNGKEKSSNKKKQKESKPAKSPEIDERLLERMERRYKTTVSNGRATDDDGVYIDYMDYF